MNVTGPEAVGFQNQAIDHPDDRGIAFGGLLAALGARAFDLEFVAIHVGHEGLEGFIRFSEIFGDGLVDPVQGHDDGFEVGFQQVAEGIECFEVQGIRNRHPQPRRQFAEGKGMIAAAVGWLNGG